MKKRGLGVLLVLTLIVAGGTLGQDLRFDNALADEREASQTLDARLAAIESAVAELRAAHAGYVATGQDPEYWMAQVGTIAGRVENELTSLVSLTLDENIRGHHQAALLALADFNSIDDRARGYLGDNQLFLASDLIFMDALDATRRVTAAIGEARLLERQAADSRLASTTWLRFGVNSAALSFLLVVALVAMRSGVRGEAAATDAPESAEAQAPGTMSAPAAALDLESDASPPVVVREVGVSRAGLDDTAELCADLARIIDSRDLPALVERTSKLLDARGIVLWAADDAGGVLQPALTHGYPERVVRRLGLLEVSADNVTSLAFRSLQPQTVNGSTEEAPGAVAVPLVTTSGCVGVLSAETRSRRPAAETLALARIVAAQFSTVIQPVASRPAPARKSAEA